jgi:hypothetical protein
MELLHALLNVLQSLVDLLAVAGRAIAPWIPLIAWVAFWTLAVDWTKLYPILAKGGIVGVLLIAFVVVLVWSVVAPPPDGHHYMFGLRLSNETGKLVYVTALSLIVAACASVQLSGACRSLIDFSEPIALAETYDDHGHGHDDHHSHADQGHGHGHH